MILFDSFYDKMSKKATIQQQPPFSVPLSVASLRSTDVWIDSILIYLLVQNVKTNGVSAFFILATTLVATFKKASSTFWPLLADVS